jgi:hypothetical protein
MPTKPDVLGRAAGLGAGMVVDAAPAGFGLHPSSINVLGIRVVGVVARARIAAGVRKPPDA